MTAEQMKNEILKLKKDTGTLILAHTYQCPDVLDIADVTGDSFALSVAATKYPNKRVMVCGVRFMAETVKILSPEKEVILPSPKATCPMAEQISPERVRKFKKENPDVCVVAYINTTTALKAECDVCVTSSSAVKIVSSLENKRILFIPDKNLGSYIAEKLPDKEFIFWDGCCPVHDSVTAADVKKAKEKYPSALLAVHPECKKEVSEQADFVGATSAIIKFALESDRDILVGTERGVADYLKIKHPERNFYQLCEDKLVCPDMKYTSIETVYKALSSDGGEKIEIEEEIRLKAKKCIDEMLRRG